MPRFPHSGCSGIVWVFYWPCLLRAGAGLALAQPLLPSRAPLSPIPAQGSEAWGGQSAPSTGQSQELWARRSIGWQFLTPPLFCLSLLFLRGQVLKL